MKTCDAPLDTIRLHTSKRFAFVHAQWHETIVLNAWQAFQAEMLSHGHTIDNIDLIAVPGVFEIPLCAKKLAQTGEYAAIVCCGLVVDGGIYRHDFVSAAVVNALMTLQLELEVPLISVVLTPHHFHDSDAHRDFFTEHFKLKGSEAAHACLSIVKQLEAISV